MPLKAWYHFLSHFMLREIWNWCVCAILSPGAPGSVLDWAFPPTMFLFTCTSTQHIWETYSFQYWCSVLVYFVACHCCLPSSNWLSSLIIFLSLYTLFVMAVDFIVWLLWWLPVIDWRLRWVCWKNFECSSSLFPFFKVFNVWNVEWRELHTLAAPMLHDFHSYEI